jgi:predicted acetyltransferase
MAPERTRFEFVVPGALCDADLELVLREKCPGDPTIQFVPAYRFQMMVLPAREAAGEIELRVGKTNHLVRYGGHIGFSVVEAHRGRRYAMRATRLLLPLARHHGLNPLWITCNPNNAPSRRTCDLLGARLVEVVELPKDTDMYRKGERQKLRYRLDL